MRASWQGVGIVYVHLYALCLPETTEEPTYNIFGMPGSGTMTLRCLVPARQRTRQWQRSQGSAVRSKEFLGTCNLGILNVASLRSSFDVSAAGLLASGGEYLEALKGHMIRYKMYSLALSKVQLFGSGSMEVGGSFTLIYAGGPGDGSMGGVGWLLSLGATTAWQRAGGSAYPSSMGRLLRLPLALRGNEGVWQLLAVYGPILQASQVDKHNFWLELGRFWSVIPSRDVAFVLGDWNCRAGTRSQLGYPSTTRGGAA